MQQGQPPENPSLLQTPGHNRHSLTSSTGSGSLGKVSMGRVPLASLGLLGDSGITKDICIAHRVRVSASKFAQIMHPVHPYSMMPPIFNNYWWKVIFELTVVLLQLHCASKNISWKQCMQLTVIGQRIFFLACLRLSTFVLRLAVFQTVLTRSYMDVHQ